MLRALTAILVLTAGAAMALVTYQREQRDTENVLAAGGKSAAVAPRPVAADQSQVGGPGAESSDAVTWPADVPRARSRAMAYAALFRAWGTEYAGGDACRQAESLGLRCRAARGGLDELRELNRPALMHLREEQGQEFHATLTRLDDRTVTLAVGGETKRVALGALAAQWSGHYTVLWRLPPQAPESIQFGERGPTVAWLSRQLAQGQDRQAESAADPVFDDALRRRVKQFQLAQGLIPDGFVGPQTLMRLSGVSDQTAPKLVRERGEK